MTQGTKPPNASRLVAAFNHKLPGVIRAADAAACWRESHRMADPHGRISLSKFRTAAEGRGFVAQPVRRGLVQIAWSETGRPVGRVVE